MAVIQLIPKKMQELNKGYATSTPTVVGAEGMAIDFSGKCNRILIIVGVATATFKAGNAIQGVVDLTVGAGQSVVLESGAFKNVSGEHKDKVFVSGGTNTTITAIQLP